MSRGLLVAVVFVATVALPARASAVSGDEAVVRAEQWVFVGMPYCQVPYGGCDSHVCCGAGYRPENPEWDPYRSDCSGLVSWAWALGGPGRVTSGFAPFNNAVSHTIDASELQAGDALNSSEHIMLFKAWVVFGSVATLIDEHNWGTVAREENFNVWINGSQITRKDWSSNPFYAIRYDNLTPSCTPEVCNGKDDDCDGQVDEDLVQNCGTDVGVCEFGQQTCSGGNWGACTGGVGPSSETCNQLDDDCDGTSDEDQVCEVEEAWQAALFDSGASTDINGDGRADLCGLSSAGIECRLATSHGFAPSPVVLDEIENADSASIFSSLRVGDVTGDGRADVCVRQPQGILCWAGTEHGLGERIVGPPLSDTAGFDDVRYFSTIRLADIDGDGKSDICARTAAGLQCFRSQGHGFAEPWLLTALSDGAGFGDVNRFGTLRFGDVDGDGDADVCARSAEGMACWRSKSGGFSQRIAGPQWSDAAGWSDWQSWSTIRLADVDGDGRADLCAREAGAFRCYLFDGAGFGRKVAGPELSDEQGFSDRDHFGTIRLGDLDGDGRADLCARGGDRMTCWLFTGNGFDHRVDGPAFADSDGWDRPEQYRTFRLGDMNADGRADLCARSSNGIECWTFRGGAFAESIAGPSWSDAAGWNAAPRYLTMHFASSSTKGTPAPPSAHDESGSGPLGGCALGERGGWSSSSSSSSNEALVVFLLGGLAFSFRSRSRRSVAWRYR